MQRYFAINKKNDEFILEDSDIRHITKVMRMKQNDEIEVVYENKLYICFINIMNDSINIKLKEEIEQTISSFNITMIIPILKEQKMDYILQKSAELGATKIIPAFTERTIVKIDKKNYDKKIVRWRKIVKEASEQSKRIDVPEIENIKNLSDITKEKGLNIVCSTTEKKLNLLKTFEKYSKCDNICVVIGPEGGLSSNEEKMLNEEGFQSVSLGSRILRVETVPLFILSILNYINME